MKLNEKGKELYNIWELNYWKENDNLGGNSANRDFVEGWCIIDNDDYVKTLTDECGLLIFAYDDAIEMVDEWIDMYGKDDVCFKNYTFEDVRKELLKYFEKEKEESNTDNVIDFLDKLKEKHPDQVFIVETPKGSVEFKIGDALIYDDPAGSIVIDTE